MKRFGLIWKFVDRYKQYNTYFSCNELKIILPLEFKCQILSIQLEPRYSNRILKSHFFIGFLRVRLNKCLALHAGF